MRVFIVNGKGGVGKDTFENMVKDIAESKGKQVFKISSVDKVKEIAASFGWNGTKELKDRKMLADLKTLLSEWNDIPYKSVMEYALSLKESINPFILFIDCREPKEIERYVKDLGASTILVKRDSIENNTYGNAADDGVNDYEYDIVIDNSGTIEDLEIKAMFLYLTCDNVSRLLKQSVL